MRVTSIKAQIKKDGRFSVFIDNKYSFSLSDIALLDSKLVSGQELTLKQVNEFKQLSNEDKIYSASLRYIAIRMRTQWELQTYLIRKSVSTSLSESLLNKLSKLGLIDDYKYAESFIRERQLLRPTSRRKLILELRQKHVDNEIIQEVVTQIDNNAEQKSLIAVIDKKRRQTKYKDDLKLMQYLARQGYNYGDIKDAINSESVTD